MIFKPIADKLVVRVLDKAETRPSGLILPESVKEKAPQEGIVIAVGPGRIENGKTVPMSVAIGDHIIYAKYAGLQYVKEGEPDKYLLLREADVWCILFDNKDLLEDKE
jgi:chaperonin GroES